MSSKMCRAARDFAVDSAANVAFVSNYRDTHTHTHTHTIWTWLHPLRLRLHGSKNIRTHNTAIRNTVTPVPRGILWRYGIEIHQIRSRQVVILQLFQPPTVSDLPWTSFVSSCCLRGHKVHPTLPRSSSHPHIVPTLLLVRLKVTSGSINYLVIVHEKR